MPTIYEFSYVKCLMGLNQIGLFSNQGILSAHLQPTFVHTFESIFGNKTY
jgi:hypothetical protein